MKNIFVAIVFLSFAFSFSQEKTRVMEGSNLIELKSSDSKNEIDYNNIYVSVDTPAQPSFGMTSFRRYIATSFKLPEVDTTVIGSVITKFTVCEDGSICDIQIVKESPANLGLGNEAKRILNVYGSWKPAVINEKAVNSYYTLPISIKITAEESAVPSNLIDKPTPKKE